MYFTMEKKDRIHDIDELLVNYITGNASADERNAIKKWIAESAENGMYFDALKEIYKATKITQAQADFNPDLAWERVKARHYRNLVQKLSEKTIGEKRSFIRDILKYAAIITIALSVGGVSLRYITGKLEIKNKEVWNTIEAPYGSRVKLTLPDGTRVWLNAGSNLKYSSLFGQLDRKVFLNGEAYFSVKTDSGKQFTVSTEYLNIKVYGTEFNVKAYEDEDIIQTTLVKGSVALEGSILSKFARKTIKLEPNQTATFYKNDKTKEKQEISSTGRSDKSSEYIVKVNSRLEISKDINPLIYTSWKDPLWVIEKEPLRSLTAKFERRFNIKFIFESESLSEYKFTGTLKDETLEQVLNLMKLSAPIDFKIENNQVYLSENKYFKSTYDQMLIRK